MKQNCMRIKGKTQKDWVMGTDKNDDRANCVRDGGKNGDLFSGG